MNSDPYDDENELDDMTEGQLADYLAGWDDSPGDYGDDNDDDLDDSMSD